MTRHIELAVQEKAHRFCEAGFYFFIFFTVLKKIRRGEDILKKLNDKHIE